MQRGKTSKLEIKLDVNIISRYELTTYPPPLEITWSAIRANNNL